MSPSPPPESPPTARPQSSSAGFAFVHPSLDSALSTPHFNPLHVEFTFGVSWFAHSLQPAELLASLADLTRHSLLCPAHRGFYFRAFGRVGRPSRRRIYLRWHLGTSTDRDSHLLEWQLASLHEGVEFELSGDFLNGQ